MFGLCLVHDRDTPHAVVFLFEIFQETFYFHVSFFKLVFKVPLAISLP